MSSQDFVNQAGKLGVFLESIAKARAVLEAAAAVENGAQSRTEAAAAAKAAEAKARDALAVTQGELATAQESLAKTLEKAAATTRQAEQEASRLLSEAHLQATTIRENAQTEVHALRNVLASLGAERSAAQKAHAELLEEVRAAEARLDAVKAEARARFGA